MQKLPAIPNPKRYEGLYAYDFGDHVSVGYTAGEIRMLLQVPAHRNGTAYQIYRVDERGGLELRGGLDMSLTLREAVCFLRRDGTTARKDYELILLAAQTRPLPCDAELRLVRSYGFEPSDLTALIYPAWASHLVSGWLGALGLTPGDQVHGGAETYRTLESGGGLTIASCTLPSSMGYSDRSEQEVLATTDQPLQRLSSKPSPSQGEGQG